MTCATTNSYSNTFISDQLDCSIEFGRGVQGCRDPRYGWRVWAMGAYDHGKLDSNANAIGYKADNWSGTSGCRLHGR